MMGGNRSILVAVYIVYTEDMLYIYINQNLLNRVHRAAPQISDKIYLFTIQYRILA